MAFIEEHRNRFGIEPICRVLSQHGVVAPSTFYAARPRPERNIHREGPWRNADDVELATLNWVHWSNHHRLHSAIGDIPPIEYEQTYYRHNHTRPHQQAG